MSNDDEKPIPAPKTKKRQTSSVGADGTSEETPRAKRPRRVNSRTQKTRTSKRRKASDDIRSQPDQEGTETGNSQPPSEQTSSHRIAKNRRNLTGGRGDAADRTCPHCGKIIVSKDGLRYHIDHYVCRKALMPEGLAKKTKQKKALAAVKKGRPRSTSNPSDTSNKRFRGSLEERTCPLCKKVFTSALGRDYHVKNSVCKEQTLDSLGGSIAVDTLQPGSKFITVFGVVEVISDQRAKPTALYSADVKNELKKFNSSREKAALSRRKAYTAVAFQSRLRRYRLTKNYKAGVTGAGVLKAYFGRTIQLSPAAKWKAPTPVPAREDPLYPNASFPDRIVECKLVPDLRMRVTGDHPTEQERSTLLTTSGVQQQSNFASMKLYLRRRLLTKPYDEGRTVYTCAKCGAQFLSRDGFTYHIQSRGCGKRNKTKAALAADLREQVEERLVKHVRRNSGRARRSRNLAPVYPQVWMHLGFMVPPATEAIGKELQGVDRYPQLAEPDRTLQQLREQIRIEREKSLGPVYPAVWNFLGLSKPGAKQQRARRASLRRAKRQEAKATKDKKRKPETTNKEAELQTEEDRADLAPVSSRRKKQKQADGMQPVKPKFNYPIIDVQVLADEIKSGRYPSMKKYEGDHDDICKICRDGGHLYCCDFCPSAVHMECLLAKLPLKDSSTEDDFMCNRCIQKVLQRRSRAEKRRQRKNLTGTTRDGKRTTTSEGGAATSENQQEESSASEYHRVASIGQVLSEFSELLADARARLHQMVEISRINNIRRLQVGVGGLLQWVQRGGAG